MWFSPNKAHIFFQTVDSDSGFVWRASKMPSSSQEETATPCHLVLLAICLMDWLFGDQVHELSYFVIES